MCDPHRQATHASHIKRVVMQRTCISLISTHRLRMKQDKRDEYTTRINNSILKGDQNNVQQRSR